MACPKSFWNLKDFCGLQQIWGSTDAIILQDRELLEDSHESETIVCDNSSV